MAERFTSDLFFIIFVLLVAAILGYLIGYLVRKSMKCKKCAEWEEENNSLMLKIKMLEESESSLKDRNLKLQEETDLLKQKLAEAEAAMIKAREKESLKITEEEPTRVNEDIPDFKKAADDFKKAADDLKKVLGIGPKISRILNNRGITTWKQLSETDPVKISEYLLEDGGELYRIHNPSTWPHQAKLADEGRWEELKDFQSKSVSSSY